MCGRFSQSQPAIHYARALDPAWSLEPIELKPSWNIAPSRRVLIFRDNEDGHTTELFSWGFLPAWADANAQKPINARVETASSKPYFRKAWKLGRCLIPADGWFEWRESTTGKQPFFIHRADDQPLLMAGLYEANTHANITSFAILTTEADGALNKEVHHRKPVIFNANEARQWIKTDLKTEEVASLASNPLAAEWFDWHAVSTMVNNARNDGEGLLMKN